MWYCFSTQTHQRRFNKTLWNRVSLWNKWHSSSKEDRFLDPCLSVDILDHVVGVGVGAAGGELAERAVHQSRKMNLEVREWIQTLDAALRGAQIPETQREKHFTEKTFRTFCCRKNKFVTQNAVFGTAELAKHYRFMPLSVLFFLIVINIISYFLFLLHWSDSFIHKTTLIYYRTNKSKCKSNLVH